jgi:type IV/VI secretion system ImpK/VasF family protein
MEHPNPGALRESLARGIREFEARARTVGIPTEKIIAARYALCTLIDENAANTPWGASGAWAQHGLLALFHGETEGGEKFFQVLARLAENPQANLDILELMYVCLQFGFEGRFRVIEGGSRQLEAVRQRLLSIIRKQRGEYERDLSGSWQGVATSGQARLGWMPLWVVGAVTVLLLLGIYLGFKLSLSGASDRLAGEIASLRVAAPVAPKPAAVPRLAKFLAKEIADGLVAVDDRADRSIVTILGDGMFRPGEATISAQYQSVLGRVGDELTKNPGQVDVIGHTDNVPIRTLRSRRTGSSPRPAQNRWPGSWRLAWTLALGRRWRRRHRSHSAERHPKAGSEPPRGDHSPRPAEGASRPPPRPHASHEVSLRLVFNRWCWDHRDSAFAMVIWWASPPSPSTICIRSNPRRYDGSRSQFSSGPIDG